MKVMVKLPIKMLCNWKLRSNYSVEFKFEACKSVPLMNYIHRISGTLHIPLLQDLKTGHFSVSVGKTIVQTSATVETGYLGKKKTTVKGNGDIEAEVSNEQGADGKNKISIVRMHLGLDLDLKIEG